MVKINLPSESIDSLLNSVEHVSFQRSRNKNWIFDSKKNTVTASSICWLFCWAKTGMSSDSAREQSRIVFNELLRNSSLNITFDSCDKETVHVQARLNRYRILSERDDEELTRIFRTYV